jgi:TonB-linked SusC/RagA family outer membrane protein
MVRQLLRKGTGIAIAMLMASVFPAGTQAQSGTISGTVTDQATGAPLPTVQVYLQGTSRNTLTSSTGTFTLSDIPPGTYSIVGQRIGYQEVRQDNIVVGGGQTATVSLVMAPSVLQLQEIVATGLIDPVEGVRSPISVARVDREMMPVAVAGNAVQNLQGRVAGVQMTRQSGEPGAGVSIMLRTPTSLRGSGAPLVVVDGVILGGVTGDANTTSIEGMDIESMEVIRGAAAASLYGSGLQLGQTQFSAHTEFGITEAFTIDNLPSHHHYLVNAAGTAYVNAQGQEVSRANRVPATTNAYQQFMDKPYPGPVFDNVGSVMKPGNFQAHNFVVSQNTESTNFAASLGRTVEQGAVRGNDGYYRNSVRLNLDHRFLSTMNLGMSMSHTRDGRDELTPGDFFTQVLQAPRDVDLSARDEQGNYLQQPNPAVVYQNPLWTQATREGNMNSNRTMLSSNYAWNPFPWLSASALVSYDRREVVNRTYVPKGTPANVGQEGELDGSISFNHTWTDTWNAESQVSLRRDFGPLNARVTLRGLMERDRTDTGSRSAENFILYGIPQIANTAQENRNAASASREVRATGYLVDTGFDYEGKYTLTILGRRDGSSLFGENARWRNYYRVAGAWRIAEESWFNVPNVSELKLSYARGTAGGRPAWDAQYETWSLTAGLPTKGQLGNRNLRPEHTTENEVTLNAILFEKFGLTLTHAWQTTIDQIVPAPLPGYSTQIVNAGSVAGHTTEFSLEANLIQTPNLAWNSLIVADYSSSKITDWPLPCDASRTWRFDCTGEPVYGIYGFRLLTSHKQLSDHFGGSAVPYADQFQVNDEGYLVWVGDKNYTDGLVNGVVQPGTWGTTSPDIGGRTYLWGIPFFEQDETGANKRPSLGTGNPLNLGMTNNVRWGNFNFHAQLHTSIGGVANNRAFQDMINTSQNFPGMDQSGKPDGLKKPIRYYQDAVGSGGSTYITEKADYIKLRTLSVNYRLNQSHFERLGLDNLGISSFQLGLTGRNIFTITSYSGFDPEQALNLNDRQNSAGTGNYPSTRTWTAEATLTF